jgi:hypothetical protein
MNVKQIKDRGTLIAVGMESSFGTHPGTTNQALAYITKIVKQVASGNLSLSALKTLPTYLGPLQVSQDMLKTNNMTLEDAFDLKKATDLYKKQVKKNTKNNGTWKKYDIDKRAASIGIDRDMLEYLTWQQGRAGTIDIITAATVHDKSFTGSPKGNISKTTKNNILNNLSANKQSIQNAPNDTDMATGYITQLQNKWDQRAKESYNYLPNNENAIFDSQWNMHNYQR